MNNLYPIIKDDYEIHRTNEESYLLKGNYRNNTGYNQWKLPKILAQYLELCNGENTHGDIIKILNIPFEFIGDGIVNSITEETNCLDFTKNCENKKNISITGSYEGYFPLHMSIEITENCNFRCKHCYISASPDKLDYMSLENFKRIASLLRDNGVKVIEITGGEPTTHKDFKEIIKYACNNFSLVALITNGYIIGKNIELIKFVSSFKNLCVQISLDGREEFHDRFRNKKGSYKALCNAIKELKKRKVLIRLAMSVSEENVEDIEFVIKKAKELNVDSFATAIISDFGRGRDNCICPQQNVELSKKIDNIIKPFIEDSIFRASRISYESFVRSGEKNCGAGWRSFALNGVTGDIRSCLFLPNSLKLGNLYVNKYEEVFSKKNIGKYRFIPAPSFFLETCSSCEEVSKCNGCMAQGFKINEKNKGKCSWYNKYIV